MRQEFSDRTVITIAHRLNTIMDSNRIMVMDKGELKEFDSPRKLLSNPTGLFSGLVRDTGPANAEYLRKLAFAVTSEQEKSEPEVISITVPQLL